MFVKVLIRVSMVGVKVRWRIVLRSVFPLVLILLTSWLGLIVLMIATAKILELELGIENPFIDQVLKLGSFGVLSLTWLYTCYKITLWYRSSHVKRGS